jgi:hypothetical protein
MCRHRHEGFPVGQSLVNFSLYFNPIAQQVSNSPATNNKGPSPIPALLTIQGAAQGRGNAPVGYPATSENRRSRPLIVPDTFPGKTSVSH